MARVKKIKIKGFTIVDNDVINDERMHLKALGLFVYMWSKPDDWQFYISEIATHFKDGESAVSSAMKELMELGYLKRTQNRKEGKFSTYDYVLQEIPKPENHGSVPKGDLPKPEKPKSEKPIPENQGLLITDNTNTNNSNTDINKHSASPSNALSENALKNSFEILWKDYPNKKGKKEAFNHYKAWRRKSTRNSDVYLAEQLKKYLVYCQQNNSWYHPMNGSTWFNGRFDDVLVTDGITPSQFRSNRRPTIQEKMPEWSKKDQKELNKKASPEDIAKLKARIANRKKVSS